MKSSTVRRRSAEAFVSRLSLAACAATFLVLVAGPSAAVTPEAEYSKYVAKGTTIQPLGDTPFGEQINLYDGSLSFRQTDIEVPGIGPTIRLVRSFGVHQQNEISETSGTAFYDWNLEIPRIKTITALHYGGYDTDTRDWSVASPNDVYARCTQIGPPRTLSYWGGSASSWYPSDWWNGYQLVDMDGRSEEVLAGSSYSASPFQVYASTKSNWLIGCLPNTANGQPGEGFIAIAPDGTRYWFNYLIYTQANGVDKYDAGLNRRYGAMLVTRIEDRFGNWLTYQYEGNSLKSITASDGRYVSVGYTSGYGSITVHAADTPSRTWIYEGANNTLTGVVNPDGSRWSYVLSQLSHAPNMQGGGNCHNVADESYMAISGSVTAPSGLTGTFALGTKKHSRSYVYKQCWADPPDLPPGNGYAWYPRSWYAYSLNSRRLTGPGLLTQTWSYAYSPMPESWEQDCPTPTSCPSTFWVDVTDPTGRRERNLFSNRFDETETLLLKTEIYPAGSGAPIEVTTNAYATSATGIPQASNWHGPGSPTDPRQNAMTFGWIPLFKRELQQDGVTFVWQANTFDTMARPLNVTRSSSLGYSRTDATAYHDNTTLWVLDQVASSTNSNTGLVESKTDYDANALPWKTYAFGKLHQTLAYNANGTLLTAKDGNNNTTTFANWKRGIPQKITFADAKFKSAVVDDLGQIASVTDENGYKTCYAYDEMGRLRETTYPSETVAGVCDTSKWAKTTRSFVPVLTGEYGVAENHWKQTVSTGNGRQVTVFDALWRPVVTMSYDATSAATTAATISVGVQRYDAQGQTIFQSYPRSTLADFTDPAIAGTDTVYDALGRPTSVQADSELPAASTTTYEYLAGFQTRVTNPRGLQTTTSYMAYDQPGTDLPMAITHPEGAFSDFTRDVFGKVTSLVRRNAASTEWNRRYVSYNPSQEICETTEVETGTTAYGYDAAGNLTWSAAALLWAPDADCDYTNPQGAGVAGRRVDRIYNNRNRLETLTFPNGLGDQAWTYTPDGLPNTVTAYNEAGHTAAVVTAYAYNRRRLLSGETITQPNAYSWSFGYAYNANGHLATQGYPTGLAVTYAPNALGQPTQAVAGTQNFATGVSYYPNGAIKQFTYGNGLTHTLSQNVRGLPDTSCDFYTSCPVTSILNDGYDYDQNGNVAAISDGVGSHRGNRTMTYDGLDRLKTVVSPMYGTHGANYQYDALDNLTYVLIGGAAIRQHWYCYDEHFQLTNIKTGPCVSGASVVGLGYDERGNLANKNGQGFIFDYGNRLRAATSLESYRYDGLGRRVETRKPNQDRRMWQYSQAGQLLYEETAGTQVIASEYVSLGGSLIATREHNWLTEVTTIKYQHTDSLGSPVAVTDANRAVIERNEYEPFGKVTNHPLKDGPGYTGHVADAATGLVNMQQRYMDPDIGRFLSVDPVSASSVGGNFNRYWYANNNPYKFTDPDGRIVKISSENTDSDKKKIADAIDKLLETKSGAEAFKKLNDSKNIFIIKKGGSRIRTQPSDQSKAENKQSVGATIFFDPDKKTGGKDSTGSTKRPGYVDLAHEFGHAVALDNGTQSFDKGIFKEGTTPPSEEQSMELENAVRKEHGLPLRPSYYFK